MKEMKEVWLVMILCHQNYPEVRPISKVWLPKNRKNLRSNKDLDLPILIDKKVKV